MLEEYNESKIKYRCGDCTEFLNGNCKKYNVNRDSEQLACKAFYFGDE